MVQVKLTKTELRSQQLRLDRLQKYLPTLQLKKALLQMEVNQSAVELAEIRKDLTAKTEELHRNARLFSEKNGTDFFDAVAIREVRKNYENIAGVDIPSLQEVIFEEPSYSLFDTPVWYESATDLMKSFLIMQEKAEIAKEKKTALEKELREVSIRVNLFEKIAIPRAKENIKRIKIFLGDQQLAAVSQAKVSKKKILERALHDR